MKRYVLSGVAAIFGAMAMAVGCAGMPDEGDGQSEGTADIQNQEAEDTAEADQALHVDCNSGGDCVAKCYDCPDCWFTVNWGYPGATCTDKARYACQYEKGTTAFSGACVGHTF